MHPICLNQALIGLAYDSLTMTSRLAIAVKMLLVAALCAAVAVFALPAVNAGNGEAHPAYTAFAGAGHAEHAGKPGNAGHAERHAADHSHDIPAGVAIDLAMTVLPGAPSSQVRRHGTDPVFPSPRDRPPKVPARI